MTADAARLTAALAGRYRIERELGAGGMATVYLAHDVKHDRDVAIKVLHPDLGAALGGERFLAEIRTTAKLQHPHILPLLDSGVADGLLYYVMPYVSGETLREKLARERQLSIDAAVRIAREVADALGAAHALGIIHRDIKPENILLQGGHALVADFGIALAVEQAGSQRMTQTGLSLGTPQYMSPEQAMGEKSVDARSDIYALGAITYEMLTGEAPFTGPTVQAIVARVLTEEPRALGVQRKSVPPGVEAAVLRALEKLPADRFASAEEYAAALSAEHAPPSAATRRPTAGVPRYARMALPWSIAIVASVIAAWSTLSTRAVPTTTRVAVALPATQQLLPQWRGQSLALSPDGTRLAYVGAGPTSTTTQVWMRGLDALDATTVPGTVGAVSVKWSPDGSALLISTDQAGSGASLVTLASGQVTPVPMGFDGEPGRSGRVYWSVENHLVRLSPGGTFDTLASLPQGVVPVSLSVTPDERTVFVGVPADSVGTWAMVRILAVDLATGDTTNVGAGVFARQLADGRLLSVQANGEVFVSPFNTASSQTSGSGFAVGRVALAANTGRAYPQLSVADDGTVVYVAGLIGQSRLTWLDANGRVIERRTTEGDFWGIALSPDGARVAYGDRADERSPGRGASGRSPMWVEDLRTGARTNLSADDLNVRPSWSPDGASVLYTRVGGGGGLFERRSDAATPERSVVVRRWFKHTIGDGRWLPDHRTLLVRTFADGPTQSRNIYAVTLGGPDSTARPIVVTAADEVTPTPSPDGTLLAYNSDESGVGEVYVQPFPSGSGRLQISRGGDGPPRWSRDGRRLYYWDQRQRLVVVTLQTRPQLAIVGVREIEAEVAPRVGGAFTNVMFDIAPDGRILVAEPVTGSYQLILVRNGLGTSARGALR